MAYRDDREALLAHAQSLQDELARERAKSVRAQAEAKKLRRDLGILTRALGRGAAMQGPAAAKVLPLIVASLVGAATLIGVNVGRVRPPACHLAASTASVVAAAKAPQPAKPSGEHVGVRLVPMGMGLVSIDSVPVSRVMLDGVALGITPLDSVMVPAGSHVFQLRAGTGLVAREVLVAEGRTTRVHFDLPEQLHLSP